MGVLSKVASIDKHKTTQGSMKSIYPPTRVSKGANCHTVSDFSLTAVHEVSVLENVTKRDSCRTSYLQLCADFRIQYSFIRSRS